MIIYFDSSALVKSVVDEEGSLQVKKFLSECLVSEEIDFVTSAITKAAPVEDVKLQMQAR